MAFGIPVGLFGMGVSGDIDGMTIYTDRHMRKVFFPQAPPCDPPSPMQVKQRARFCEAISNWRDTSQNERDGFESISLRASLRMTGLNLWIHVSLQRAFELLATLRRQTGIMVANPPAVDWPEG